jgi:chemotaxis protein MotB
MRNFPILEHVTLLCLVASGLFSSCVSKAHYDLLDQNKADLLTQLNEEKKLHSQCEEERQSLDGRFSSIDAQNMALRNTNQMLVEKNRSLSNELLSIKGETLQVKKSVDEKQKALELASDTYADLVKDLKGEVEEGKVTIQEMQNQLKVALVERIVFPAGTVELNEAGKQVLDKVAKTLKNVKNRRIQIEGHSDDSAVPANMQVTYPTNWEVSARRATSVVRYLQEKGVDPSLMAAVGLAHYHPIATNKDPKGRQVNRRIEIVLTPLPLSVVPSENK